MPTTTTTQSAIAVDTTASTYPAAHIIETTVEPGRSYSTLESLVDKDKYPKESTISIEEQAYDLPNGKTLTIQHVRYVDDFWDWAAGVVSELGGAPARIRSGEADTRLIYNGKELVVGCTSYAVHDDEIQEIYAPAEESGDAEDCLLAFGVMPYDEEVDQNIDDAVIMMGSCFLDALGHAAYKRHSNLLIKAYEYNQSDKEVIVRRLENIDPPTNPDDDISGMYAIIYLRAGGSDMLKAAFHEDTWARAVMEFMGYNYDSLDSMWEAYSELDSSVCCVRGDIRSCCEKRGERVEYGQVKTVRRMEDEEIPF